jgi:hypothetical protein
LAFAFAKARNTNTTNIFKTKIRQSFLKKAFLRRPVRLHLRRLIREGAANGEIWLILVQKQFNQPTT